MAQISFRVDDIKGDVRAIEFAVGLPDHTWYDANYVYTPLSMNIDVAKKEAKDFFLQYLDSHNEVVSFITICGVDEEQDSILGCSF